MATPGNLETLVLQKNCTLVCEAITNCADVVWFADRITEELFLTSQAKGSIIHNAGVSKYEKCSQLMSAVETQVKADPNKYHTFLSILQEELAMQSIVTILSESYALQSKMRKAPPLLKQQSQSSTPRSSISSGTTSPLTFEMSIPEFAKELALLITDLVELLDKYDGALERMKTALENLVLPLSLKRLVRIVQSQRYEEARSVRELFKLLAPYWSCIDCSLLQVIVKASGCQPAIEKLEAFLQHRSAISPSLMLCNPNSRISTESEISQDDTPNQTEVSRVIQTQPIQSCVKHLDAPSTGELQGSSNGSQPCRREITNNKDVSVEVEAKVDVNMLTLRDYDDKTSLLCSVLKLPRFALSYLRTATGCLLLVWQMSANLVSYVQSIQLTDSDLQLLAKQRFSYIKVADSYHICIPSRSYWDTDELYTKTRQQEGDKFLEACREGSTEKAIHFINSGVDVNYRNGHQETALILASAYGHADIVEVLLNSHASVDLDDVDGHMPLHAASYYGHVGIVHMLLHANADPNAINRFDNTSLLLASFLGHSDVVRELLNVGVRIGVKNMSKKTALDVAVDRKHWLVVELLMEADQSKELISACENGHSDVVLQLLKDGADPDCQDEYGVTALSYACGEGHSEIVEALLNANADPNIENQYRATPLHFASYHGHQREVELLLAAGANPDVQDEDGMTPLQFASYCGHHREVELLLGAGANPDLQNKNGTKTPLGIASYWGHERGVELLLAAGANPDMQTKDGRTPLHLASYRGHHREVELLLAAGANPNLQDKYGYTALNHACRKGHSESVEALLNANADPSIESQDGWTPLCIASYHGHHREVELFLTAGINPDLQDKHGFTALMIAVKNKHWEIVDMLTKVNINLNIQEQEAGWTALMFAAKEGDMKILQQLISAGADVNVVDKTGATPADIAEANGHSACKDLLAHTPAGGHVQQAKDDVEESNRKERILQTTNLLNALMQALEHKFDFESSLNEDQPKKGIPNVEDITHVYRADLYPVMQDPTFRVENESSDEEDS